MNVIDLVTDSLRRATIIGQTATPSAEQGADAVTKLNDVMASLAGDGIDLGWNPKATTAETFVFPAEHVDTIKALLVLAVCGGYGADPPLRDVAIADAGYKRLLRQAIYANARETRTDNLPRGDAQSIAFNILTGN